MAIRIDERTVEAAVLGGAVFGGGGGGSVEDGRSLGRAALELGLKEILSLDEVPAGAMLLTVSAVGAPSAGSGLLRPEDYIRAVELFREKSGARIDGLISSEVGALGAVNGWVQSAALGVPVIDAPCNGRAHPLGLMGSMGLERQGNYVSSQAAVGGREERGNRVEEYFRGPLAEVSGKVREAAVRAGGMVAVARNIVPAAYVRSNGAPGAVGRAIEIGNVLLERQGAGSKSFFRAIYDILGCDFIVRAKVGQVSLETKGGLDIGRVDLRTRNFSYELTFWNEYMTLEREGIRMGTFPDLIMTFDATTGDPLTSDRIREGDEVVAIVVLSGQLSLGAGVKNRDLLRRVEEAVGKDILGYRKDG